MSRNRASDLLGEVERAVSGWRAVAATLGFTKDETESFADAFEHKECAVAQRVMS